MKKWILIVITLCAVAIAVRTPAQQSPRILTLTEQGKKFTMISPDDLPDDWMVVAAAGGVGGGGAWEYVTDRIKGQNLQTVKDNTTVLAAQVLSKHLGKTFNAVIRNE